MSETLVQKLMKRPCITLDENCSIKNLVDTLNKNKVGCVIITSSTSNYPVGIVSERDLVRNYYKVLNNKYSLFSIQSLVVSIQYSVFTILYPFSIQYSFRIWYSTFSIH